MPKHGNQLPNCRFNTQPPEGGWQALAVLPHKLQVSTHSRPKAAAGGNGRLRLGCRTFQHTAARRRLLPSGKALGATGRFQHTAARRRLPRPRATSASQPRFNTQPPEGGCRPALVRQAVGPEFQHTAARRRLYRIDLGPVIEIRRVSTHSRPKAAEPLE